MQTADPNVNIEESGIHANGAPFVVYASTDGQRWRIDGTCNQCGECWVGTDEPTVEWTGTPVGEAGAFVDLRTGPKLDCPVRPEIKNDCPNCTLSGEYL